MAPVRHLDRLAILRLDFNIWSGQVKLDDPDIKLGEGGKLPPKDLVELGRKAVIDKDHLRPFHRMKTRARRLCLSHGMPFLNGFAIPLGRIDTISCELDKVAAEMRDLKAAFLDSYDDSINDWVLKNPEYAQAIRAGVQPRAVVERRIDFGYQVYQIAPVNQEEARKLNDLADGLVDDLLKEIVEEANAFFHNALKGRDGCQLATRNTLLRLSDKVEGLSFLDRRFLSVVDILRQALSGYAGASGKLIQGEPFYRIFSAVLVLSSRDKIQAYADSAVSVNADAGSLMLNATASDRSAAPARLGEAFGADAPALLPDESELDSFFESFNTHEPATSGDWFF